MRKGKRLREWNQGWRCWTHIKHMFCWRMPLRHQSCNMYWEFFDSLGRVANVSLEGDVCKHAGLPVSFGCLGCRRAGYISLPTFIASINYVGELVESILFRINIADTNELAEAVESWRGTSGGVSLSDDPRRQKAWDLPIVKKNWDNMLLEADRVSRARLMATAHKESGAMSQCFAGFVAWGHYWSPQKF